ncbi:co-chaperone DjlA [Legionella spiritensis]|uniref:co-chaperone DjlA n=1 Tax=Legionella spiritensis TaxID=452 RepID=UPI0007308203|nr:co-chaperone DjlA [Legionella spiritensis]
MNFRQFFTTNTWWGKLLGAFFGYQIGGSVGAFLGILIGNFFDKGLSVHFGSPHWRYHHEKREAVQKVYFEATFAIMGHLAKADGRVSEQEIALARTLMSEMRLNHAQKTLAKRYFSEGKQPTFDLLRTLSRLQNACRDNPDLLKLFMDIQYRAAMIDGISEAKINKLDIIFKELGFAPLHKQYRFYEDLGARVYHSAPHGSRQRQSSGSRQQQEPTPQNTLAHAYAILEMTPQASKQEIKRAYRRLISRNHPDRLIAQGLPEEMIKLANDKTHKITKAYELICASKGW